MTRQTSAGRTPARSDEECTDHAGMDGTEDPGRWRETGENFELSEHQTQRRENPREAENYSPLHSFAATSQARVTHGTGSRELQPLLLFIYPYPLICLGLGCMHSPLLPERQSIEPLAGAAWLRREINVSDRPHKSYLRRRRNFQTLVRLPSTGSVRFGQADNGARMSTTCTAERSEHQEDYKAHRLSYLNHFFFYLRDSEDFVQYHHKFKVVDSARTMPLAACQLKVSTGRQRPLVGELDGTR
uniref:Uncharacterized protein n=1 Tax=Oryza punctata TaxID=4537 RepID=A0A0E0KCQ1_ORYPU